MKYKLKLSNDQKKHEVDVPQGFALGGDQGACLVVDGQKQVVELLADGRSMMIGQDIVRIEEPFCLKEGQYRARFQNDGQMRDHFVEMGIVHAVAPRHLSKPKSRDALKAPIAGKVLSILVAEGASVRQGDILLVVEAMKMENRLLAESDGVVKKIYVGVGDKVAIGDMLIDF